ncbi:MAG: HD domain-containing phosphohydrolase [Myxococcota bacterium]
MTRHSVLFVDDEAHILKTLGRLLRSMPIDVLTAQTPDQAMLLLAEARPQVVVSDYRMPGMSGVDFLAQVRDKHPKAIRMMLTGYTEMEVVVGAINRGEIYRLVTKPFTGAELRMTLQQAFEQYALKEELERLGRLTRDQNVELQALNRDLERRVQDRTRQLACKNASLQQAYMETLLSLAEAIDAKDSYTCGHSRRVGAYAARIATLMKLPEKAIGEAYVAGLLHDLGKIGVGDSILQKPGPLTEEEYEQIKKHPEIGSRIIEPIGFLKEIEPYVRHHHEWYDGSQRGYPDRLCGEQIPLIARILMVADTVEAMTSDRAYRKAVPVEAVIQELGKFRGSQFDPEVSDACVGPLCEDPDDFLDASMGVDLACFFESRS